MAKKARRDNKKEKNVKQVMKAEEVAGYRGNEDTDAILMSLGENPRDAKKRKKKGRKSLNNELEDETNPLEDEVLNDDFSKFMDQMGQFKDRLHADYVPANMPIQIFAGPEYESVNPEQLKKIEIEIRSTTSDDKISTAVINREIQNPDYFQISRKKVEGFRPIFDREELKIKPPKRGREKNTRKKVSRKFQTRQKYRRQTEEVESFLWYRFNASWNWYRHHVTGFWELWSFGAWRAVPEPFNSRLYTEEENGSASDCDESLEDENNNLQTIVRKRPGMRGNSPVSGRRMQPEAMGREIQQEREDSESGPGRADKCDQSRLDQLQIELQETINHLREVGEELSLERKTNDQLRAKILNNDFFKYNEILGQMQKDNQNIISHIRESPGLKLIPQVQDVLITLDEFSARLVIASEELNSQYEQSQSNIVGNKDMNTNELQLDLSSLEPPSLGTNFLNFLQSFIIMGQSSSHPTTAPLPPLAFTTYPPPLLCRPPSSMVNLRSATPCRDDVSPTSPKPSLGSRMTGTLPCLPISPHSSSSSHDTVQSAISAKPNNSTSQNATGTRPKVFESGTSEATGVPTTRTGKRYDNLIAQLKGYHPNLSLADAHSYLMELRQSNNGKLSGMSIQDIKEKVASLLKRDRGMACGASTEDKNCSICFDDMSPTIPFKQA